jgi:hypothetical protein
LVLRAIDRASDRMRTVVDWNNDGNPYHRS